MSLISKKQIFKILQDKIPTNIEKSDNEFAILLPIINVEQSLHILFEVRAKNIIRQPSEVCFPGGRIEPSDKSAKYASIRETCEELGINSTQINDVFPIGYIESGITIHAFAGFIDTNKLNINTEEVETIFTIPLQELQHLLPVIHQVELIPNVKDDFPYHLIPNGRDYKWQSRHMDEYFYQYENKVIWGLTARILYHFLEMINLEELECMN